MRALLLAPLLLLTACSDSSEDAYSEAAEAAAEEAIAEAEESVSEIDINLGDVDVSTELQGSLVDAVTSVDGEFELGVTDEVLFSRLSESLREDIQAEMDEETADETGLGGTIARAVTSAVAEGLGLTVSIPLDQIADVRFEDGQVVIEMADGSESPFASSQTDGEPMLEQFSSDAGQRLADAFDKATN